MYNPCMKDDTLAKLGKLVDLNAGRDAVHIAVAPVVADERLSPGQHIGLDSKGRAVQYWRTSSQQPIGVVDPFLLNRVNSNERFWIFLYPNTITSLRHVWSHPAFSNDLLRSISKSEKWLRDYADSMGLSYGKLIEAAQTWIEFEEYHTFPFDTPPRAYDDVDTFWKHYAAVTGTTVPDDRKENFFACAC